MKVNLSHLYVIRNKVNGKLYYGITTQNPVQKRWIGHKTVAKKRVRKTPLVRAMNKYGFENFEFIVLKSDIDRGLIATLEVEYIKEYKTQDRRFGYNLSEGGEINVGFKIPKEVSLKRSKDMTGQGNHFYGKSHSEETRIKISKTKTGVKLSEETKAKMKGRRGNFTGKFGINHPAYGKERAIEVRKSIQLNTPHRIEIYMIDKDTDIVLNKFLSKKEAGRWLFDNGHCQSKNQRSVASTINRALKLETVSYGFKWKEVDERQSTIETVETHGVE